MTETKPKRRWFRFGLRTLFVLMTIFGVVSGWVAYQFNWIRQRHEFLLNKGVIVLAEVPKSDTAWTLLLFGERQVERFFVPFNLRGSANPNYL
jgi:hypothetical protein